MGDATAIDILINPDSSMIDLAKRTNALMLTSSGRCPQTLILVPRE